MPFPWPMFRERPRRTLDDVLVVMYTRQSCHLCERAWEVLGRAQSKYGFRLESVDIGTDSELEQRFGKEIPVVLVNGKLRFRSAVQAVLLERLLHAEAQKKKKARGRD